MRRLILLTLCAAAACGTPTPRTDAHWRRISDQAQPLEQARPACKAHAMEKSESVKPEGLAAKVAAGAFAECMRERGWSLVDQDGQ